MVTTILLILTNLIVSLNLKLNIGIVMKNELKSIVTKINTLMGLANNPNYGDIESISTKGENTFLVCYSSGVEMSVTLVPDSKVMVNTTDGDIGVLRVSDTEYVRLFNVYVKEVGFEEVSKSPAHLFLLNVFGKDKLRDVIHSTIVEYAQPLLGGDVDGEPKLTAGITCAYIQYPNGDVYYVGAAPFGDGMSVKRRGVDNGIVIPTHTPGGALRYASLVVLDGLYKINNDYFSI